MGQTQKVVIEFKEAFWRADGLSGGVFSHKGPLGEIHDACTKEKPALFGFVSASYQGTDIKADTLAQLKTLFGQRAEEFTSSDLDRVPLRSHPEYGYDITHFEENLFFIGTESSFKDGGYLEGALLSARKVADLLTKSQ